MSIAPSDSNLNSDNDPLGEIPLVLQFRPLYPMTPDEFYKFACQNPELRLELNSDGEVVIMSPTGGETSNKNFKILLQLGNWNESEKLGVVFDSSVIFTLPKKAARSPDASWIQKNRWDALSKHDREVFSPICPDFVIELRSKSDNLAPLKKKMEEYLANGVQLGWLIDPLKKTVHIYRAGTQEVEILDQPTSVSGDSVLPGFVLQLEEIFT